MTKEYGTRQPIQPIVQVEGVIRFKANKIVQYLLDNGGIDLNALARVDFPQEDREQFAQLIGYSLSGFGELSFVRDDTFAAAARMADRGESEDAARIAHMSNELETLREMLKGPVARLYGIHPDDLMRS